MKTLDEVEPRIPVKSVPITITQSGSYYLTGDLSNPSVSSGAYIIVDANNVTIDMMGFSLKGPGKGLTSNCYGVWLKDKENIEVRNGTICDFKAAGILGYYVIPDLTLETNKSRFMNLRVYDCGYGIFVGGSGHTVQNCTVTNNTHEGIYMRGSGHVVRDCVVNMNSIGIFCENNSLITGCVVQKNAAGINCGKNCSVTGNTVCENTNCGIAVFDNAVIKNNLVYLNKLYGINAASYSTVTDNQIKENGLENNFGYGLMTAAACCVKNNTFIQNKYNLWVGLSGNANHTGNCIEDNYFVGSIYSIYFGYSGNYFADNRFTQHTSAAWAGYTNTDGGGNVSY